MQSPSRYFPLEKYESSEELRAGESGRRKLFSLSVEKKESMFKDGKYEEDVDSPKMTMFSVEIFQSQSDLRAAEVSDRLFAAPDGITH